jgi:DNA ligase (NAD+)
MVSETADKTLTYSKTKHGTSKLRTGNQLLKEATGDWYRWAKKKATIPELVKLLEYLSDTYYNKTELVPDSIFDLLNGVLVTRDPNNPFFDQVGAPIQGENKEELPIPLMSLDKVRPDTETLHRRLKDTHEETKMKASKKLVQISDKLDGISALIYRKNGNFKFYTRGDGKEGQDISHLLPHLVSKKVLNNMPSTVAVRGELIMTEANFRKFSKQFKNARNLLGGLVNSKTMDSQRKEILRYAEFIPYRVYEPETTPIKQFEFLKEWGFTSVWHTLVEKKLITTDYLQKLLEKRKLKSPYGIDGLVITKNLTETPVKVGNPLHSFAFKNLDSQQVVDAEVEDIHWIASRYRYLKPTIRIKPTMISGVMVEYATAFNAKWVFDNKIGKGSKIKLIRSGDVIPYIVDVTKSSKEPLMPSKKWKWGETNVDAIGVGPEWDEATNVAQMSFFFETLKVRGLGEGVVKKLYDAGYTSPKEIIQATAAEFAEVERMGKRSGQKLTDEIKKAVSKTTLPVLMVASQQFGRGVGIKRIKTILKTYPDICFWNTEFWTKKRPLSDTHKITASDQKWINKVEETITNEVAGFEKKTARLFAEGLLSFLKWLVGMVDIFPQFEFTKLKKFEKDRLKTQKVQKKSGKKLIFQDQKVVFTGFRDPDLQEWIEAHGADVVGSVSKKTSLVVYRGEDKSKAKKAQQLGVKMITYEAFIKKYKVTTSKKLK